MHLLNIHHCVSEQGESQTSQYYHSIPVDFWICNLLLLSRENVDSITTGVSASIANKNIGKRPGNRYEGKNQGDQHQSIGLGKKMKINKI